jgi:hypothetical protein
MTPDERRKNEAIVRGLKASLETLPGDMHSGIHSAIAYYENPEGNPYDYQPPPELPRNSMYNRPITFTPKVTVGGKELNTPNTDPFRR